MKATLLSKAALCVCPPVVLATSAMYVPPVRKAVHHATAPHRPVAPKSTKAAAHPAAATVAAPCADIEPAVPLATFADDIPDDLPPAITPATFTTPIVSTPIGPSAPPFYVGPTSGAVPEPGTWALMIVGFGLVGAVLRRFRSAPAPAPALATTAEAAVQQRRVRYRHRGHKRRRFAAAGTLWGLLDSAYASTSGATAGLSTLAKVAMCVCPPLALATTVATVPPVKKAVYAATAPSDVPHHALVAAIAPPCDPALTPAEAKAIPAGAAAAAAGLTMQEAVRKGEAAPGLEPTTRS